MALLSKSNNSISSGSNKTIITNGCNFSGKLFVEHNILIDGSFEGIITAKENVSIGSMGVVRGELTGKHIVISGLFDGKVTCSCLEIMAGGQVKGQVMTETFLIDKGGTFLGESLEKAKTDLQKRKTSYQTDSSENKKNNSKPLPQSSSEQSRYVHRPGEQET